MTEHTACQNRPGAADHQRAFGEPTFFAFGCGRNTIQAFHHGPGQTGEVAVTLRPAGAKSLRRPPDRCPKVQSVETEHRYGGHRASSDPSDPVLEPRGQGEEEATCTLRVHPDGTARVFPQIWIVIVQQLANELFDRGVPESELLHGVQRCHANAIGIMGAEAAAYHRIRHLRP